MYISWWLSLSSCIRHLKAPMPFICRLTPAPLTLVLFIFLEFGDETWKVIGHAAWCVIIYVNHFRVWVEAVRVLFGILEGGRGYVHNVISWEKDLLYPRFITYFGQLSSFSCRYIFPATFGVISFYFTFELEGNIIVNMMIIIRHF